MPMAWQADMPGLSKAARHMNQISDNKTGNTGTPPQIVLNAFFIANTPGY